MRICSPLRVTVEQVERLDRRRRLAGGRAEAVEVVVADQHRGGVGHGVGVERHRHVPDAAAVERRRRAAIQDQVAIAPPRRREAGVEVGRHDLGLDDRRSDRA